MTLASADSQQLSSAQSLTSDLSSALLPLLTFLLPRRYSLDSQITTMSSNRMRRVGKELADIQADKASNISCEVDGADLTNLRASFPGPPDTPYEGGTYMVGIKIPTEYPFRPPVMQFKTKLWHPNVSSQTVRLPPSPSPQILTMLGSHLSRHSGDCLVPGAYHQVRSALSPVTSQHT